MKFSLRRAGVLLLVLVLCLAVVGVGYGKWTGTLHIRGDMTTAQSATIVGWTYVANSDEANAIDDTCSWNWDTNKPVQLVDGGNGKHVGATTTSLTEYIAQHPDLPLDWEYKLYRTVVVTLDNVYPSYAVQVFPTCMNKGPMPAKIMGWTIYPDWYPAGFSYMWDDSLSQYVLTGYPTGYDPTRPYNVYMSDGDINQIVLQPDCANSETFELVVHVEQAAQQNTTYTFTLEVYAEPAV